MLRFLYSIFLIVLYIPYIIVIFLRIFLNKEHKSKFKEKLFSKKIQRPDGFLFWFHVASLGEFKSILPIIEFYLRKDKKYQFLITTITLSSYNQFKKKFSGNKRVFHQFLPYDLNILIKSFLDNWKPNIISFVDSEIWPNFIYEIKKRKIPFILLNGRITKKTFKRWMLVKAFAYDIFESFSLCIASSKESVEYLKLLKLKNIKYFGNIKFCSNVKNNNVDNSNQFNMVKNKKAWIALSTHQNEENFCFKVHRLIETVEKNVLTIIIPRHINRVGKIYSQLNRPNIKIQIKNENDYIDKDSNIVLVNYYGLTEKYLSRIKNVFIGKSLVPSLAKVGGQNPIDAIKMGCKVYHGPFVYNFKEIYDYLDTNNFSEVINENDNVGPKKIAEKLIEIFNNNSEISTNKVDEINNYSEQIFDNIINEYSKFIK